MTALSLAAMNAFFGAPLSAQALNAADQAAANAAIKVIRPEAIAAHERFLSDDLLEGRRTGSRGHELAVQYVATELEAMGLAPGGVNGTWFQNVPIRKVELVPEQNSFDYAGVDVRGKVVVMVRGAERSA